MYLEPATLGEISCPPGYTLARDGCIPEAPGTTGGHAVDPVIDPPNCPPFTQYHAPTDSCRPLECLPGFVVGPHGYCIAEAVDDAQQEAAPPPQALPPLQCPAGYFIEFAGTRSARCAPLPPASPPPAPPPGLPPGAAGPAFPPISTFVPGAPGGSGGTSTVTIESDDEPGSGFGLVELLIATGLGILVSRAVRGA